MTTHAGMDRSTSKDTQRLEQILNSTKVPFATVFVDSRSDPDATHWKKMLQGNIGNGNNTTYPQLVAFGKCIGDIDAVQELVDSNKKTWLEDLRPPKAPLIGKVGYGEQAQELKDRDASIRSLERKLEITKEDLKQKQATASGNVEELRLALVAKDKEIEKLKRDMATHQRELEVSKKELSLSLSQIKVFFHARDILPSTSMETKHSRSLPFFVFVRSYLAFFSHLHASYFLFFRALMDKDDDSQASDVSISRKELEAKVEQLETKIGRLMEQNETLNSISEENVEEKRNVEKQLKTVRQDLGKVSVALPLPL